MPGFFVSLTAARTHLSTACQTRTTAKTLSVAAQTGMQRMIKSKSLPKT